MANQLARAGLTTPEMAADMGALGGNDAVLLGGNVSGQLLVQDAATEALQWPGMRHVSLGLIAEHRG